MSKRTSWHAKSFCSIWLVPHLVPFSESIDVCKAFELGVRSVLFGLRFKRIVVLEGLGERQLELCSKNLAPVCLIQQAPQAQQAHGKSKAPEKVKLKVPTDQHAVGLALALGA